MLNALLPLLFALGIVGSVAAILGNAYARHQLRHRAVEDALRAVGAAPVRGPKGLTGDVGGLTVRYQFFAVGKNKPPGTRCAVTLPAIAPRFEMELRPQTAAELRNVEHGRAVDLVLKDQAFDDAFIVEAAPASTARVVLDHVARTRLLTFDPCRMSLVDGTLVFETTTLLEEPAEIRRVIEVCLGIATRLLDHHADQREKRLVEASLDGSMGYRGPAPDALVALDPGRQYALELAHLHQVRALRKARDRAVVISLASVVSLGIALIAATRGCH